MRTEEIVIGNLFHNEEYSRKVLPYIKEEYFSDNHEKIVFIKYKELFEKYKSIPTLDAIGNSVENDTSLTEGEYEECKNILKSFKTPPKEQSEEWLLDTTEQFCQDRSIHNSIIESIQIIDGNHKSLDKGAIPKLLSDALSVSFDHYIGHDYLENVDERYEFYHKQENKIPFDIDFLNLITKGGVSKKSMTILMAGTGVGKSLAMAHMAAANLMDGKNVLYVTAELSEESVAQRIDANLLNIEMDDILRLSKAVFDKKVKAIRGKTSGKLVIKEYPTATSNANNVRYCLNELMLKKKFVPDIIYVDYLNIMTSYRIRNGANVNTNTYVKSIAEEFRGLGIEKNVAIVTATQFNRGGMFNSDPNLDEISESIGVTYTGDCILAMIQSEEQAKLNHIVFKQLKNRWGDINRPSKFVVGVNKAKMKLFDIEEDAQDTIQKNEDEDDTPSMDNSRFGERMKEERSEKVGGFKF